MNMPKVTLVFAGLLVLLGLGAWAFVGFPSRAATALIPAFAGIVLAIPGIIAVLDDRARKHAMHAAAMIGLLGAALAAFPLIGAVTGGRVPSNFALVSLLGMLLICATFVALCVKSFIDARKARVSTG